MDQPSKHSELSTNSFNEYNAELQAAALKATRNAAYLPSDLAFYRSLDRHFAKEVDTSSARVLSLANRILDLVSTGDVVTQAASRSKGKGRLADEDDVIDNFRPLVVDAMDQLLERADICLDQILGLSKAPGIVVNPQPVKPKAPKSNVVSKGRLDPALQHASHLAKPQLKFKRRVDNRESTVWRPSLKHKYNAQVPLGFDLRQEDEDMSFDTPLHPYRHEIRNISYPSYMFRYAEPIPPKSFTDTPFAWVSSPEEFASMLEKLRGAPEIAIDLEYHSYRSYTGFVCLMQISTREGDWIVDTLSLREELEALNEVFTDPNVVKVLHGAESDIIWLQQDFNLYIVNMFDTYHASRILEFPKHGLATLMEMYCDFIPDKRYQLADWRIRPLPEEMLQYARSDTHFLLFIYDNLRNALLDRAQSRAQSRSQSPSALAGASTSNPSNSYPYQAFVLEVLSRSAETALRVCDRERYDADSGSGPGGWDTLARKWNKGALMASERDNMKRRVYKAVHAWRDRIAREEDESTRYVLSTHYLFMIAEQPPTDLAGLLSLFHPVPPVLRRRSKELLDSILAAAKEVDSVPDDLHKAIPEKMDVDDVLETTSLEITATAPGIEERLWPSPTKATIAATSSSLFGATLKTVSHKSGPVAYLATQSSLFPTGNRSQSKSDQNRRFSELVARIHSSLVIAPSAPQLPRPAADNTSVTMEVDMEEVVLVDGQVEIPFVPASQRQESNRVVVDDPITDSIVVVGHTQRKKRRRAVKSEASAVVTEGDQPNPSTVEAFDYSTVSNILDEGSDHEPEEKIRRKKQRGQGRFDYGNFRAPPKEHREVKSGNQSRTFK